MIETIILNLKRGENLLSSLTDEQYSNRSVPPYFSSIGGHIRHILDIFDCIFEGLDSGKIDLTNRKRNVIAEEKVQVGRMYFKQIIDNLKTLENYDLNQMVFVQDDLGSGIHTAKYSLAAILIQAHSHAIHHFASLGYVIARLGIELPDADFGYNPTTPRNENMSI